MITFATVNLFFYLFSPDDNTVKSVIMEYRVFKSKPEQKLYRLYYALRRYFEGGYPENSTGYYYKIGPILPYLFQCLNEFWGKSESDYSKIIKK